jgi:2'-5' RNA ligase
MHLTLAFAGDATDAIGAAIVESMSLEIAQAPFELAFGGVGTFPTRGAPRVLWLGVIGGADAVLALHATVAGRFEALEPPRSAGLIWNDLSSHLNLRTISKAASKAAETAIATVDHSDIRGSEPHNRDPSGATSD